jgi:hypothetical protein
MLLQGIEFGIGFWIASFAIGGLLVAAIAIAERHAAGKPAGGKEEPSLHRVRRRPLGTPVNVLKPEIELRGILPGFGVFLQRTIVTWPATSDSDSRRKEPRYRY